MARNYREVALRYGVAAGSIALATWGRVLLDPAVGGEFPYATLFFAVLLAAWYGGFGPALAAVALGALSSSYFLIPPRGSFAIEGRDQQVGMALYVLTGLGIAALGGVMRASQGRAERAREAERLQRERLHVTLQSIGDAVIVTDPEGRVTLVNPAARALTGWTHEQALGVPLETVFRIVNEETRQKVKNPALRAVSEGVVVGLANHTLLIARDGTERPIDDSAAPIRDATGGIVGGVLVFRDVSQRRRAEEALRRSENRKAAVLNAALDAILTIDGDGRVVEFNPAAEALFGYPRAEAVGADLGDLIIPPRMREGHRRGMAHYLATGEAPVLGKRLEMPARRKDGSEISVELVIARLDGDRPLFTGFLRDVTARKKAEEALAERMRLLALDADVAAALVQCDTLPDALQRCAAALVNHLEGAFARIWTLNAEEGVLELQASAGLYTHLDGPHGRVPVGQFKIGLIAKERRPHLTNAVVGDGRVPEQAWARREGMVAFAGYPLVVEDRLVGVMAMFARKPLTDSTLGAMAAVANGIALGVERKRGEERLREQREWLRTTLSSIGDAVLATDVAGRVTFLNPVAEALTGWTQAEAQGGELESVFRIVNEQSRRPVENPVAKVLREGAVVGLANHTLLVARDGSERPIDDSAAPIRDEAGALRGVVLVFRDVSDKKRAEEEVRRAGEQARTILESITDASCALDRDWRFTYVNRQAEVLLGRGRDGLLGRSHWAEYPDTLGTDIERNYRRAVAEGVTVEFETFYPPHDRWYEIHAYPSPGGLSVYFRDVGERKRAEIALRESERRFRQLADAMPQIVWTARPEGNIDYLNRRWVEFTGLPETVGNDGWGSVLHPDDSRPAGELWAASLASGSPFEMEVRLLDRRQQTYRWHLIRTVAVRDESGRVARWFGTGTDIDGQKRAEESSRYLADASAALAGVVDYESTLQKVANLAVPYFADWSAVDVAGEDGGLRRLAVAHRDTDKVRLAHELVRHYPPDLQAPGGIGAVYRTGKPELMGEITDDMLVQGARDERHLRLLRSLGLKSYLCVPLVVSGNPLGVLTFATAESGRQYTEADLALATDLAHRAAVAVENTQLYQALREADRRKDEFLATLAHELRNPLAPIRNSLQILKMPRVDAETVERSRDMMERQVHHLVRLVDDLLDVSRVMRGKIELRRERVELATVVARAVETVQPLVDAQAQQLSVRLPPESLPLDGDTVRLAQVVGNLLTNAAKYTEPNGRIWLSAERDGGVAVLRVRDNGIGIAPDMLPRVFELFVQADHAPTKAQGGLGIGLTLVKNLVEMHDGSVEAHSAGLGKGSEFVVRLPVSARGPGRDQGGEVGHDPDGKPPRSGYRLLVVDDNRDAANSLATLLELQGHEVRVAYSGAAALEVTKTYTPDVVFLDIGMPGMDGYEVARRMRGQPGLGKAVMAALTGWGQQEDRRRSAEAGFDRHLVKPPEPEALDDVLGELKRRDGM